jgi:folate-binding protein YgfZ
VTGPDRARFLHNLTTNDVKRLGPGQGCEAFVTSLQGKTLGWVTVHVAEDRILVRGDAGSLQWLGAHFQKYGALDDVAWNDTSAATFEVHVCGPAVDDFPALRAAGTIASELGHQTTKLGDVEVLAIRESPTGAPGITLIGNAPDMGALVDHLVAQSGRAPLPKLDRATFDILRVEAGTPVFGRDITPENLPQEVGRDRRAINFVKGCYLGQETVARIDALGHVNKHLTGVRIEGECSETPEPGSALERDGKLVGTVTSPAVSPGWGTPVLLAYVRTGSEAAGTALEVLAHGKRSAAVVADLPMLPSSAVPPSGEPPHHD